MARPVGDIRDRIDVALEKMRAAGSAVRAIYLTEADLDRLNKVRSREFGMALHTHGYRDHIVRPGKHSVIYSTRGVATHIPQRLSAKVAA